MHPDDREALLRDATALVGSERLPELRDLLRSYLRERALAGPALSAREMRDRAQLKADSFAAARRAARTTAWDEFFVPPPSPATVAEIAEQERAYRQLEAEMAERIRHQVDRLPGSPRWRFAWALAELFAGAGRHVGAGPTTAFHAFVAAMFAAAGEDAPERLTREVAQRWQARANGTLQGQKSSVASSPGG